jgi:hypothetical protein
MLSAQHFCPISPKFRPSRRIFMEVSSTKFHENPSNGNLADMGKRKDGRKDRRDKTDRRFTRVGEHALKCNCPHLRHEGICLCIRGAEVQLHYFRPHL